MEKTILHQYLNRKIDVILGGGSDLFGAYIDHSQIFAAVDHFKAFADSGYSVVRSQSELERGADASKPVLGIFSPSHIPYAIDRANDTAFKEVPSLPSMFEVALERLRGSEEGFVLQVEAGRVDHAGHANDAGAILMEQLEFDDCLPIALDFLKQEPDTLLIVTTDHGTGGCQLDGYGERYLDSKNALAGITQFGRSFEWLQAALQSSGIADAQLVKTALGIDASDSQLAILQKALDEKRQYLSGAFIDAFKHELRAQSSVGWSSAAHTGELVDFYAIGPGADALPPTIRNHEVHQFMTQALGIS